MLLQIDLLYVMIPSFPIGMLVVLVLMLLFFAVLFLQSGLDKIMDRKGNLAWLTGHFENSPLGGMVPILLTVLTVLEMLSGIISLVAAVILPFVSALDFPLAFLAFAACGFSLLLLFFGQRMAKDYAGAAGIVPYFLVALLGMLLTSDMI